MNWAAWVLLIWTAVGYLFGFYRLGAGRKAQEPARGGVAFVACLVLLAFFGTWLWLFLTAVGVLA